MALRNHRLTVFLDPKEVNDLLASYSQRDDYSRHEPDQQTQTYPYRRPSTVLGNPYSNLPKPAPFSTFDDSGSSHSRQQPLRIHNPLNRISNLERPQPGVRLTHRTLSLPVQNNLEGFDNLVNGNYSERQVDSYVGGHQPTPAPIRNDFGFNGELAEKAQRAYDWLSGPHHSHSSSGHPQSRNSQALEIHTSQPPLARNTRSFGSSSQGVDISVLDSVLHSPGRGTEIPPRSSVSTTRTGFQASEADYYDEMAKTTPNWRNSFSAVREQFKNDTERHESPVPNFASNGSMTMPRQKLNGSPASSLLKSASQPTFNRLKPK